MENYQKGENVDCMNDTIKEVLAELSSLFPQEIDDSTKVIHVRGGSKLKNLIPVATNQCTREDHGFTVIVGCGNAVGKVVSLAEVLKKRCKVKLLQANTVRFTSVEEIWNPTLEQEDVLEALKVVREIPFMAILLMAKSESRTQIMKKLTYPWTQQLGLSTFCKVGKIDNVKKKTKKKRS